MYKDKKLVESHFRKTEELIRNIDSKDIAEWLLNFGYYPESNILPPSFCISNFKLNKKPYNKKLTSPARRSLIDISYPKSLLTSRKFSIQHPFNYHDIVYYLNENWNKILDTIFHKDLKIYSYSSPIPVSARAPNKLSNLREGRMIYEWIEMAEKDIVVDSTFYLYLAKTDITNFYASIYTHSIAWALHGRENALADTAYQLFGNKIDKLVQYANDARTNGLAIGSALSDLIAEIILSSIDLSISNSLSEIDFIAVRFKDDYRVLCQSENDAKLILKTISIELSKFNLILNENKTSIYKLPDGLYRVHDREYFPHSIRSHKKIFDYH